jgi:hypothetical protein
MVAEAPSNDETTRQALALADEIGSMLDGRHPLVQSIALANLLASHVAGYPELLRMSMLDSHVKLVRELTPMCAAEAAERLPTMGSA